MKDCRKIEWLIADHIKTKIQTIMACDNIIGISVSTFWMLNGRRKTVLLIKYINNLYLHHTKLHCRDFAVFLWTYIPTALTLS